MEKHLVTAKTPAAKICTRMRTQFGEISSAGSNTDVNNVNLSVQLLRETGKPVVLQVCSYFTGILCTKLHRLVQVFAIHIKRKLSIWMKIDRLDFMLQRSKYYKVRIYCWEIQLQYRLQKIKLGENTVWINSVFWLVSNCWEAKFHKHGSYTLL